MFAMFLCTQPTVGPPAWEELRQFVVRRDQPLPSGAPSVYLYRNISSLGRIVPICGIVGGRYPRPLIICSEVSWPPLGIIFSSEPHPFFSSMANVTHWGEAAFGEQLTTVLQLPPLRVETDHPLAFGTVEEVERWRTDGQVLWFVVDVDDPEQPTSVSMTWRPRRTA
jgi:hypothetical protein